MRDDPRHTRLDPVSIISIHVPRMRDDFLFINGYFDLTISIHVPRMRDDMCRRRQWLPWRDFNPRPSHEGRPAEKAFKKYKPDISIHVPRMRDDARDKKVVYFSLISIHVPRMRDDVGGLKMQYKRFLISIHVPRMRDDWCSDGMKGETHDFNPRPSHEGRLQTFTCSFDLKEISIHVPRMRDDYVRRYR